LSTMVVGRDIAPATGKAAEKKKRRDKVTPPPDQEKTNVVQIESSLARGTGRGGCFRKLPTTPCRKRGQMVGKSKKSRQYGKENGFLGLHNGSDPLDYRMEKNGRRRSIMKGKINTPVLSPEGGAGRESERTSNKRRNSPHCYQRSGTRSLARRTS